MPTTEFSSREDRTVKNVHHVVLSDIGRVVIRQGDTESLQVEADRETLPNISSVMEGDTLVLGMSRSWNERIANSFTLHQVAYHLTVTDLESIELKGISNLEMYGVQGKTLEITTLGHISVKVEAINVLQLVCKFQWATTALMSGEVTQQEVTLSGSSKYRASKLLSQQATFNLSDKATAEVNVEKKLVAVTSGDSSLQYSGSPKVVNKGSGGSIQKQTT